MDRERPNIASPSIGALTGLALAYLGVCVAFAVDLRLGLIAAAVAVAIFARPLRALIAHQVVDRWREANARARAARQDAGDALDLRPLAILGSAALVLTSIRYFGGRALFDRMAPRLWVGIARHPYFPLASYGYWALYRLVHYVIVPLALGRLLRISAAQLGWSIRLGRGHLRAYGTLLAIATPAVVVASGTPAFRRTYPFYPLAGRSLVDWSAWSALYAAQFFALETFFRGFLIHPLQSSFGAQAVVVAALPYCMIHFRKPIAEALGALVAALALGTLSLASGSIWPGWLLHVSIAWLMDGLAILRA